MPKIEVRCALEDYVRTLTAISRLMAGLTLRVRERERTSLGLNLFIELKPECRIIRKYKSFYSKK